MRVRIDPDQQGYGRAKKALQSLARVGGDQTELWDVVGADLVASTIERFERGVAPDGQAWPQSIRAREEGGKTLVDRGHLRDSITHAPDATGVTIGTNVIYARIHQLGGVIVAKASEYLTFNIGGRWSRKKSVEIPARPFLGVSDDDADNLSHTIGEYLQGVWQQ